MLIIIELIFLAAGVWALVSGKLPEKLLRLLFGKGEYEVPPARARLYGILLASPLPMALLVSSLLRVILGSEVTGLAIAFEYIYLIVIIIASIAVARTIRHPVGAQATEGSATTEAVLQPEKSYATRLLIIFGLAFLSCTTVLAAGTFIATLTSILVFGGTLTGDFSKDYLPFIIIALIAVLGLFGSIKLIKLLKR